MEKNIKNVEEGIDKVQEFVFNIRKFFSQNPKIEEAYKKFLEENEELIY